MPKNKTSKIGKRAQPKITIVPHLASNLETITKFENENKELKEQIDNLTKIIEKISKQDTNQQEPIHTKSTDINNIEMEIIPDATQGEDQEEFIQVLKKKNEQRRKKTSGNKSNQQEVSTTLTQLRHATTAGPSTQGTDIPQQNNGIREVIRTNISPTKPPPINILYQDPKETIQLITSNSKELNFHIKRLNKIKLSLQLNNIKDFQKAKEALTQEETKYCIH